MVFVRHCEIKHNYFYHKSNFDYLVGVPNRSTFHSTYRVDDPSLYKKIAELNIEKAMICYPNDSEMMRMIIEWRRENV